MEAVQSMPEGPEENLDDSEDLLEARDAVHPLGATHVSSSRSLYKTIGLSTKLMFPCPKEIFDFSAVFPIVGFIGQTPLYMNNGARKVIFLCIHGAGLSGVSFAPLASSTSG